jgi:hypothetical protein
MKGINYGRVGLGGLVAGLVLNIGEFILNELILADRWIALLEAYNLRTPTVGVTLSYAGLLFVFGIGIVYLYAAIRPRYGPGPKTAMCAGLIVWFFVWLLAFGSAILFGILSATLVVVTVIWGLVEVPLAAVAGAWLYREEGSTAASSTANLAPQ